MFPWKLSVYNKRIWVRDRQPNFYVLNQIPLIPDTISKPSSEIRAQTDNLNDILNPIFLRPVNFFIKPSFAATLENNKTIFTNHNGSGCV